jgi:hypothetical protein
VLGCIDGEWILRPGSNATSAVTAENINPLNDTTDGSCAQIPCQVEGGALAIRRDRKSLNFVKFSRLADLIETDEVTISARHILSGLARRIAFQRDPNKVAWIQCLDGSLIAFTYMPKEKVIGFTRRPFINGLVEDVCVSPKADGTADVVTVIVQRQINGATRRYVEEFAPFFQPLSGQNPTAAGAWFLDCALSRTGAPVSTIGNLSHLEGQTVGVFADGAMQSQKVVAAGSINLDQPAGDVLVGIPQHWHARLLPIDPQLPQGSGKGAAKFADHVLVEFAKSMGGQIRINAADDEEAWENIFETGAADYGDPLKVYTGRQEVDLGSNSEITLDVELRGLEALPFTLSGVTPAISFASG